MICNLECEEVGKEINEKNNNATASNLNGEKITSPPQ